MQATSPLTEEKKEIIKNHIEYANRLAAKFYQKRTNINLEKEDYVSAAMFGLCDAATRFDPGKGENFSTYSYFRIRCAMYELMRNSCGIPRSYFAELTAFNSEDEREQLNEIRLPYTFARDVRTLEQLQTILEDFGVQVHVAKDSKKIQITYSNFASPEQIVSSKEAKDYIRKLLYQLDDSERKILNYYYFKDLSYLEIGELLGGISKSWVSRIHKKALKKLREVVKNERRFSDFTILSTRIH